MESIQGRQRGWSLACAAASFIGGVLVAESLWSPPETPPFRELTDLCLGEEGARLRILLAATGVAAATLGMLIRRGCGRPGGCLILLGLGTLGFLRGECTQVRWESEFASLRCHLSNWTWVGGEVEGRGRKTPWGYTAPARLFLPSRPRVRLEWNDSWRPLPGDAWEGACRLGSLHPPTLPGRSDPRVRGRMGGTVGTVRPLCLYASRAGGGVLEGLPGKAHRELVKLGTRFEHLFAERLSPRAARFLSAFLLGRRDLLEKTRVRSFQETGIAHLLAISGLHVGFIALSISPLLGWAGRRRLLRLLGWCLFLAFFARLTGGAPPVWRASLMILSHQIGLLRGSRNGAFGGWFLGAMAEAWFRPAAVLGPSFTLSYGATLALILTARRGWLGFVTGSTGEGARTGGFWRRCGLRAVSIGLALLGTARASAVVLLVTGPLLLAHFGRWLPLAVIHNVLLVPAAGVLLPSALGCLALASLPGAPGVVSWVALDTITTAFLELQGFAASRIPSVVIREAVPVPLAVLLTLSLCALLMGKPWPRRGSYVLAGFLFLAVGLNITKAPDGSWSATFLSVGRGESVLLRWPSGRTWLVDAGPPPWKGGEPSILRALQSLGVHSVERVFVTHGHGDHAGGLEGVLESIPVDTVCLGSGEVSLWDSLRTHSHLEVVEDGWVERPGRGITVSALHPPAGHALESNEASIVLRVEGTGMSLLLTGDLEARGEEILGRGHPDLAATVMKVPHHGRSTSSTSRFLRRVQPSVGIILGLAGGDDDISSAARRRVREQGALVVVGSKTGPLWLGVERNRWVLRSMFQGEGIVLGLLRQERSRSKLPLACGGSVRVL